MSVYKKETPEFLVHSLNSILKNQTLSPTEVIIVKDGTLTKELDNSISWFESKYPEIMKVFGYSKNKGLGYALNFGLSFCSYELVFRMDTDDISLPHRFQEQLNVFESNPEVAIVGSYIEEFNDTVGDLARIRTVPLTKADINRQKLKRCPFNHMTVGFRKSTVQNVGGYLEMANYEDYYLWIRLLNEYEGLNINKNLVYARVGNNMIARRQGLTFFLREFAFQKSLKSQKLINKKIFFRNFFLRVIPRLLPVTLLSFFYHYFLRENRSS